MGDLWYIYNARSIIHKTGYQAVSSFNLKCKTLYV